MTVTPDASLFTALSLADIAKPRPAPAAAKAATAPVPPAQAPQQRHQRLGQIVDLSV
jgi:hypothetical protein